MGLYLLQTSIAVLWSLVAAVFLHLTKRDAMGLNLLHSKELQGEMMNNVIPLKRSEHLLPDDEFEALVAELNHIATRYAGFMSLPAAIRKTLSDALKRDRHGPDLISTPDHVIAEKFREKLSLRETISELQALIEKQGGYNFEALREERDDGETDLPVT